MISKVSALVGRMKTFSGLRVSLQIDAVMANNGQDAADCAYHGTGNEGGLRVWVRVFRRCGIEVKEEIRIRCPRMLSEVAYFSGHFISSSSSFKLAVERLGTSDVYAIVPTAPVRSAPTERRGGRSWIRWSYEFRCMRV